MSVKIKCKCGKSEMTFLNLKVGDIAEFDCGECEKSEESTESTKEVETQEPEVQVSMRELKKRGPKVKTKSDKPKVFEEE